MSIVFQPISLNATCQLPRKMYCKMLSFAITVNYNQLHEYTVDSKYNEILELGMQIADGCQHL